MAAFGQGAGRGWAAAVVAGCAGNLARNAERKSGREQSFQQAGQKVVAYGEDAAAAHRRWDIIQRMAVLADRIVRHADALEREGRSPLYLRLMRGAAASAREGGVVARAFPDGPGRPESVPALRLLAALHQLVLAGMAPDLAEFYPSVGGERPATESAWTVAEATIEEHLGVIQSLASRPVQTNEPGRSAVLYGGLLWLSERFGLPIELMELGASAGLNLHVDRFIYLIAGERLGGSGGQVTFREPWRGMPVSAPARAAGELCVIDRQGCDRAPIDPASRDGELTLLSYIWPDELDRLARVRAAIAVARQHPIEVEPADLTRWAAARLAARTRNRLTVVWQSVVRQYLSEEERVRLQTVMETAGEASDVTAPLAWLTLEPSGGHLDPFELTCHVWPGGTSLKLAGSANHGPPVYWTTAAI